MNNKQLLDRVIATYVPADKAFPPVSDWHSANTYAMFNERFKDAYYNDKSAFKEMRGKGKGVGLAIGYGGTEYTVSENLNISTGEAEKLVIQFKSGLPTFVKYDAECIKTAKIEKQVKDLFGRIRYLPNIEFKRTGNQEKDKLNRSIAKKCERLAVNAPIQMTGATQIKLITINIGRFIEDNKLNHFHGNLIADNFIKHIAVARLTEESQIRDLCSVLDEHENGNILIIFGSSKDNIVAKYSRLVKLTVKDLKDLSLSLVI